MSDTIAEAFQSICATATRRATCYLVLYRSEQFYGGPEEGGWYGTDDFVEAYQEFPTEEAAEVARKAVEEMADRLTQEAEEERNMAARRACEWAESRGESLDGPDDAYWTRGDQYWVTVQTEMPSDREQDRHWE